MPGFTRQQLLAAKAGVVGVTSIVAGFFLGRDEGDYAASILVAGAILSIMAAAYEFLAYWLASWFGGQPNLQNISGPLLAADPASPSIVMTGVSDAGRPRPFLKRDAVKVIGTFLAAQLLVWIVGVIAVMNPRAPLDPAVEGTAAMMRIFPVALPLSMLAGALAVYLLTRRFARRIPGADESATFGLVHAGIQPIALGATTGALLALLLVLLSILMPATSSSDQGLLAQLLATSATGRIVFGLTAVLLAPPVEEYVFRGVMLGTLLPAGEVAAGVLSGVAFWMLHVTEWIHYWPAALGIGAMTALVTLLRFRSRSIVPGIFAHMFYNGALTLVAFFA